MSESKNKHRWAWLPELGDFGYYCEWPTCGKVKITKNGALVSYDAALKMLAREPECDDSYHCRNCGAQYVDDHAEDCPVKR